MRAPQGACFNCGQPGHFVRELPTRDQPQKPAAPAHAAAPEDQFNLCEVQETLAVECIGSVFCVNCKMIEHAAVQCENISVHDDLQPTG